MDQCSASSHKADFPFGRRILSIDGGGILGTFPISFLAEIEQHLDNPIGDYFDLIAGTSTGGILAIALALGIPATDLLRLYEKKGPGIFGQSHRGIGRFPMKMIRCVRHLYRHKYDSDELRDALTEVLGNRRLGEAQTRLIIPAWSPVAQSVYIYKTAHHDRLRTDYKALALDVALATSAAPTYFRQYITATGTGLIDGGVWASNPIALAVTEAIGLLKWSPSELHVLRLSCLQEVYAIPKWAGIGTLELKAINLFMDGQSYGAMGMAKILTGDAHERQAIHRIDHKVPRGKFRIDDTGQIPDLKGLGHIKARESFPLLRSIFFTCPAETFIPVHSLDPMTELEAPHEAQ